MCVGNPVLGLGSSTGKYFLWPQFYYSNSIPYVLCYTTLLSSQGARKV